MYAQPLFSPEANAEDLLEPGNDDASSGYEAPDYALFEDEPKAPPVLEERSFQDAPPEKTACSTRTKKRRKSAYVPPASGPASIYDRLAAFGLLRKLTELVMVKAGVPWHLQEDAIQEVHATWVGLRAKPEFERGQVANYAYLSGQHAALKLRRHIGAVVSLPGTLFKAENSKCPFLQSIGAALSPMDVDDFSDSVELSITQGDLVGSRRVSQSFFRQRLDGLGLSSAHVRMAYKILVEGKTVESAAIELGVSLKMLERMIGRVVRKLNAKDEAAASSIDASCCLEEAPVQSLPALGVPELPDPTADEQGEQALQQLLLDLASDEAASLSELKRQPAQGELLEPI